MSAGPQHPDTAEVYDSALRFTVQSRRRPNETHLVDLGAYGGEGRCDCKDFATRFEKFLRRGYTAEQVWEEKWITELREYQLAPADCLSCWHLVNGRQQACRIFIRAMIKAGGKEDGR